MLEEGATYDQNTGEVTADVYYYKHLCNITQHLEDVSLTLFLDEFESAGQYLLA